MFAVFSAETQQRCERSHRVVGRVAGELRQKRITVMAANIQSAQDPKIIGGSDNECSVKYADCVVDIIPAWKTRRTCEDCAHDFIARRRDLKRGRGRFCSRSCAARNRGRGRDGAKNSNWRGGRASRPYESYVKRFKIANPEKARAHQLVRRAVVTGALIRQSVCETCGGFGHTDAHHPDYSQPLMVQWLCKSCHSQWHQHARNVRHVLVGAEAKESLR